VDWDKPVVCVIHDPVTQPAWNYVIKPPNFIPYQNAEMPKKKLMPYRRRVTMDHVVNVYGTGLTATQRTAIIEEINKESLAAVEWGRDQVKQRMMFAMTRVGLKVGDRHARNFSDIKNSLRQDSSNPNIARIFEICYGDYEGPDKQNWSSNLEKKYMREMRLQYVSDPANLRDNGGMRDKGGIEMCITKAKVDMMNKVWCKKAGITITLSLKGETRLPAEMIEEMKREKMMVERKEGKAHRRTLGEFYVKMKVRKTYICAVVCDQSFDSQHVITECRARVYGECFTRV
jgi:hypothetical protein